MWVMMFSSPYGAIGFLTQMYKQKKYRYSKFSSPYGVIGFITIEPPQLKK